MFQALHRFIRIFEPRWFAAAFARLAACGCIAALVFCIGSKPDRRLPYDEPLDTPAVVREAPAAAAPVTLDAVRGALPRLQSIFLEQGVPRELVLIAEVESAWNARAESRRGALGLYQLMPETARRFGLSLDGCPYDERILPYKSAEAAARYLRALHEQFGSWRLALAAYNAGEGRVARLLRDGDAADYGAIEWELPSETQTYVARVYAAIADHRDRS